jgi:hypothetical protein
MVRTIDASKIKKIKYRPYPINITCNGCGQRTRIDVDQKCDTYCYGCLLKITQGKMRIPSDDSEDK